MGVVTGVLLGRSLDVPRSDLVLAILLVLLVENNVLFGCDDSGILIEDSRLAEEVRALLLCGVESLYEKVVEGAKTLGWDERLQLNVLEFEVVRYVVPLGGLEGNDNIPMGVQVSEAVV